MNTLYFYGKNWGRVTFCLLWAKSANRQLLCYLAIKYFTERFFSRPMKPDPERELSMPRPRGVAKRIFSVSHNMPIYWNVVILQRIYGSRWYYIESSAAMLKKLRFAVNRGEWLTTTEIIMDYILKGIWLNENCLLLVRCTLPVITYPRIALAPGFNTATVEWSLIDT